MSSFKKTRALVDALRDVADNMGSAGIFKKAAAEHNCTPEALVLMFKKVVTDSLFRYDLAQRIEA